MNFNKVFNKILIVDGSYMLHRSLHLPELFNLSGPDGSGTGGIFGFLRTFQHELKIDGDYFPIVTFDNGLSKRRVEVDEHYKRADERESQLQEQEVLTPEESRLDYVTQYREQRNKLIQLLFTLGVPCIKMMKWEGDDIMYLLSKMSKQSMVLTDDRDMLQLLTDTCIVRRPMADEVIELHKFLEDKGFDDIYDFVICKAILGDKSDSIPGSCKGVGEASANSLIKIIKYFNNDFIGYPETEEDMRNLCEELGIKYKKAFLNFDKERFIKNMKLVDLNLVEADENVVDSMISLISNCKSGVDYFNATKLLNSYGIKEVSVDSIISLVSQRYNNLMA